MTINAPPNPPENEPDNPADIPHDQNPDSTPESPPDFAPVPLKYYRHDGWTPERQRDFIDALARSGSVVNAARSIGMGHAKVYDLRNRPGAEEFAAAWDDAIATATDQVHHVLVDHAVNGAVEPIMFGGVQVGEFRRYNYRMMMWLLRHHKPEQFNLRQDAQGSDAPALSDQQMKALKAEWRAEWEAERAAKDKVQMEEFLAAQEKRKAEHQADFHAKIETMRTRMIANYERGDRAGGQTDGQTDGQNDGQTGDRASQQKKRFNPARASVMEMLVYDEVAGDGAAREDADDPGHEPKDDPGKAVRDKMGFPPLAKNDPAEGGTKI